MLPKRDEYNKFLNDAVDHNTVSEVISQGADNDVPTAGLLYVTTESTLWKSF